MQIQKYKLFLASPGDTKEERQIVTEIINDINNTFGSRENFFIELLKWETTVYPDFGEYSQAVINKKIGVDYDIFVGLMWKRFGTPTDKADSGTVEEFELAYQRFKNGEEIKIMFYFNSSALPQDSDFTQFSKVGEFKKRVISLGGLYWNYNDLKSFEKLFRNHITNQILDSRKNVKPEQIEISFSNPKISSEFEKYLDDTEIVFAHSSKDLVQLSDLYIAPDLKLLDDKKNRSFTIHNLDDISGKVEFDGIKYVLAGNDVSGKTSNCKYLFSKYFRFGFIPILLKGYDFNENIRIESLESTINNLIKSQYENALEISNIKQEKLIIIIDDFHKSCKGKSKYWPTLIDNLSEITPNLVLTGNTVMTLESVNGKNPFDKFDSYTIMELGPKFRHQMAYKWYSLGLDLRFADENEINRKIDFAFKHIKTIIGNGYITPYPFYILSILQSLESGTNHNQKYSVHGFYYEHLINECINKAVKDKEEIGLYFNYLTHFCFHLFELSIHEISKSDFQEFHELYCKKYDIVKNQETILRTFFDARILHVNEVIHVKEKYIYYFFVAKFISNQINNIEMKDLIKKMICRIFRDEYASIIMFVTHLSKDQFIINELIENANKIFEKSSVCKLENDIYQINDLIKEIPGQVVNSLDVKKNREEAIQELENQERNKKLEEEFEDENSSFDNIGLEDDISKIDFYAKITLAIKTIDILGQITKKYWGELDGEQKLKLVNTTYDLSLRTLSFYIGMLSKNKELLVKHISDLIEEKHIKDGFPVNQKIKESARDYIFKLCFLSAYGLTKRVSNSIGLDKLKTTFDKVLDQRQYNSTYLIDFSIRLSFSSIKSLIAEIENYEKNMSQNKLSFMLLRNLAIDHLYMFDTDYKTRTKIFQILKISQKEQLKIDQTSNVKRMK
jgi:hypothetical protein